MAIAPPGDPRPSSSSRPAGSGSCRTASVAASAVPRPYREIRTRRRARPARARLRTRLTPRTGLRRELHRHRRRHARRALPRRGRPADASPGRGAAGDRAAVPEPQRRQRRVRARRPAVGRHGRRRRRRRSRGPAQNPDSLLGKMLRLDVDAAATPSRRSGRSACATRGATRSIREPATCGSATSARTRWRRSTTCRARCPPASNFGWRVRSRARSGSTTSRAPDRVMAPPWPSTRTTSGCSVTGGEVVRDGGPLDGQYLYGDYCSGNLWMLDADDGGRRAGGRHRAARAARGPTSFGRDGQGRVLLTVDRRPRAAPRRGVASGPPRRVRRGETAGRLSCHAVSTAPEFVYSMHRVDKFYGPERQILKDISLSFFHGAKIGVLGPNGAGKSHAAAHHGRASTRTSSGEAWLAPRRHASATCRRSRSSTRPRTCAATSRTASREHARRCSTASTRSR